jgi:hypothetical protein
MDWLFISVGVGGFLFDYFLLRSRFWINPPLRLMIYWNLWISVEFGVDGGELGVFFCVRNQIGGFGCCDFS